MSAAKLDGIIPPDRAQAWGVRGRNAMKLVDDTGREMTSQRKETSEGGFAVSLVLC
jgi:hypothetical protein